MTTGITFGIFDLLHAGHIMMLEEAKRQWLSKHLASVHFSHIDIIAYGTPKQIGRNGILFDDEEKNRTSWNGIAYDVDNILEILRGM